MIRRFRPFTRLPVAAGLAGAIAGPAAAAGEIVTVTTLEDHVDIAGLQGMGDLPGPDGLVSFREALIVTNNTPGPQTIHFAIPQSEWWLFDDRAILRLEDGVFEVADDETTIDFTTQTLFTGDTNPNGWEVGIYGLQPNGWGAPAIHIGAENCTVIGLDRVMQRGQGVRISGNDNRVINCTISGPLHSGVEIAGWFGGPPASGNVIGGTGPDEGNFLSGGGSGVRIAAPADDNVVIGNTLTGGDHGVWALGSVYSTTINGNRIGGPTPEERNIIAGAGSYCCEGAPSGGQVVVEYGVDNIVEGNWIGLTADGSAGEGQTGPVGVDVRHSSGTIVRDNVIGDIIAFGANHYAGEIFGAAIQVGDDSAGTVIQGNKIGTDVSGTAAISNYQGIVVASVLFGEPPTGTVIGGTGPGEGNLIANSDLAGIRVNSNVVGTTIRGNRIKGNTMLGIDLNGDGVTPNDPGDGDLGANNGQNFPVIETAVSSGTELTVGGTLASVAGQTYAIDLFAGAACDASGFGEGARYVGSFDVVTGGAGLASFDEAMAATVAAGEFVTATATRLATGDTSEFSACLPVEPGAPLVGDVDGDGSVGTSDLLMLLAAWGACPGCPGDLDGDGAVGTADLLILLSAWG